MPDKKLMTFVQWVAHYKIAFGEANEEDLREAESTLKSMSHRIIYHGLHGDCNKILGRFYMCRLCQLQKWLSEYHKYFKQNK